MHAFRHALLALALAGAAPATAQRVQLPALPPVDSAKIVVVRLLDWTELRGHVVERHDSSFTLVSLDGERLDVPNRSMRAWELQDPRLMLADPNTSRLFFATTGRTIRKGTGYVANYFLFFPSLTYGLTDRLTVSGGVSIIPAAEAQFAYASPKLAVVRSPSFHFAVGALWVTVPDTPRPGLGAGYGAATFGGPDNAVTVTAGYPFSTTNIDADPILMLGAERRVTARVKLMTELWSMPGIDGVPLLVGLRWFGAALAVDFGLASVLGGDAISNKGLPVVPWLDFSLQW